MSIDTTAIQASAQRLFPNTSLDQVLVELLLERAQKNLISIKQWRGNSKRNCANFWIKSKLYWLHWVCRNKVE
jgi:hypothetical protein